MPRSWAAVFSRFFPMRGYVLFSILCALGAIAFTILFVRAEDPVYFWDSIGYHSQFRQFGELVASGSFARTAKEILFSIRHAEHNVSPLLLPLFFYPVLGGGRVSFILSLTVMYLIPVCIIAPLLVRRFFMIENGIREPYLVVFGVMFFLSVPFWKTVTLGLPDMAALLPLCFSLYLALQTDITERKYIKRMVLIGICIYVCFLFRRWYAFTVIAFYCSFFFSSLWRIRQRTLRDDLKNMFANLSVASLTTLGCLVVLQFPYFRAIARTDYSYAYTAFQLPLLSSADMLIREYIGLIPLCLACAGVVGSLVTHRGRYQHFFVFLTCIFIFLLFTRVQSFSPHHSLPLVFLVLLLASSGVIHICGALQNTVFRSFFLLLLCVLCFGNMYSSVCGLPIHVSSLLLAPSGRTAPLKHPGLASLQRLYSDLEALVSGTDHKVSVVAGDPFMSPSLISFNGPKSLADHIVWGPDIDKRDGIGIKVFLTKYLIVYTPTPPSSETTVIAIPTRMLLDGSGLGAAYAQVRRYDFGQDRSTYLFEKQRAFTQKEVAAYLGSFPPESEKWPEKPTELDRLMLSATVSGGEWENLQRRKHGRYRLFPSRGRPLVLTMDVGHLASADLLLGLPEKKKRFGNANCAYSLRVDDEEVRHGMLGLGETVTVPLRFEGKSTLEIRLEDNGSQGTGRIYFEMELLRATP